MTQMVHRSFVRYSPTQKLNIENDPILFAHEMGNFTRGEFYSLLYFCNYEGRT